MSDKKPPPGELFTRAYVERGAPTPDDLFFRNRLNGYLWENHQKDFPKIAGYIQRESGLSVPVTSVPIGLVYDFGGFLTKTEIEYVLDTITLIWRFLHQPEFRQTYQERVTKAIREAYPKADAWHAFVARALREQHLGYVLDEECGVHYYVDKEFERNRISAVECLGSPRYAAVLDALRRAFAKLDERPQDTNAAVREMFIAAETLTKLLAGTNEDLDERMIQRRLKPLLDRLYGAMDGSAQSFGGQMVGGFTKWVNAGHRYRHAPKAEAPHRLPLDLAVLFLSNGASFLRWLAGVDATLQSQAAGAAHDTSA